MQHTVIQCHLAVVELAYNFRLWCLPDPLPDPKPQPTLLIVFCLVAPDIPATQTSVHSGGVNKTLVHRASQHPRTELKDLVHFLDRGRFSSSRDLCRECSQNGEQDIVGSWLQTQKPWREPPTGTGSSDNESADPLAVPLPPARGTNRR